MADRWEALKSELAGGQDQNVPVRVKGKPGKFREPCLMRDVEDLVRKKETFFRFGKLGSSESLKFNKYRNTHKKAIGKETKA